MHTFLIVATAHFLALLSPGPDFLLIVRTSLAQGWRAATAVCAGIALGNAAWIGLAFAGASTLHAGTMPFKLVQAAGSAYLGWLGVMFIRHGWSVGLGTGRLAAGRLGIDRSDARRMSRMSGHDASPGPTSGPRIAAAPWACARAGLLSALFNPKNGVFYASLATSLPSSHSTTGWRLMFGVWMTSIVLAWDLGIAASVRHPAVVGRFERMLPGLEVMAGCLFVVLGVSGIRELIRPA